MDVFDLTQKTFKRMQGFEPDKASAFFRLKSLQGEEIIQRGVNYLLNPVLYAGLFQMQGAKLLLIVSVLKFLYRVRKVSTTLRYIMRVVLPGDQEGLAQLVSVLNAAT